MSTKVVLVTGASSGIGKSIAQTLKQKGFTVYGTARNPKNYPDSMIPLLPLDVTDEQTIHTCISNLMVKEERIDVLINNAGRGINGTVEEMPIKEAKHIFDTNFFGAVAVAQAVIPHMRMQESGYIVNITSIAGFMGLPFRGFYSASKSALNIITESMRMELKPFGIEVCSLAPGDFATDIASRRYNAPIAKDSPYFERYNNQLKQIDDHVDGAMNPEIVGEVIYNIVNKSEVRVNYAVGSFLQKLSIYLKRLLPSKLFEAILSNHYKQ